MAPSPDDAPSSRTHAVVLNWNGAAHTLRCVRSLDAARADVRVIVVDNGSTDGSVAEIAAACPGVCLVRSDENRGYSGGVNLGIRRALADGATRVLLLNNDVELAPDALPALEAALDADPSLGAVGPIVTLPGEPTRIWAAGGELAYRENISRLRGFHEVLNGQFPHDEDVDYVPGCVVLLPREVIERVGELDESFFCYMEDVEYGRRIVEAGYRNRLVVAARAVHEASASTGGGYTPARKYMNAVNSVRYLRRHPSLRGVAGFLLFDVLGWPLALVNACRHGRPGAAFAKARGIVDGLRGVKVTPERVARYLRDAP